MAITTRRIRISTSEVLGTPLPGGRVHFTLSAPDQEGAELIAPVPQPVDLDESGDGIGNLWPNSKGSAGTFYNVTVRDRYNRVRITSKGVMPDVDDTQLSAMLQLQPSPPVDAATQAVQQAQGFAAQAGASAQAAQDAVADHAARITEIENIVSGLKNGYTHDQQVALATWTVNHNMGKNPAVLVEESTGDEVEGSILYDSPNSLRIVFTAAISGKAYLN